MRRSKFFTLFILFCTTQGRSNNRKKEDGVTKIPQKDVYSLIGKGVASTDSIVSNKTCRVIFLFSYYDCGGCIDLGFSITEKMNSLYRNDKVAIISTMGSPSSFQKRNKYYEYIYPDSRDLIGKELKYVPTPITLLLSSSNYIKDYIFPSTSNDREAVPFIEFVLQGNISQKVYYIGVTRFDSTGSCCPNSTSFRRCQEFVTL